MQKTIIMNGATMQGNIKCSFAMSRKLVYDPLLIDIFRNITDGKRLSYKGHAYDKMNFYNDKQRLSNDLVIAMQEARKKSFNNGKTSTTNP